jgi:RNA polymerase sigma-32 factor
MKARGGRLASFIERAMKHEILTREDEQDLATQYRKGAKIDDGGRVLKPTLRGKPAGEKLVQHNLRFALREAHKFQRYGFNLEDLFQVAVEGVCEARDRFDPSRGFSFLAYAQHWTTAKLHRYCTNDGAKIYFSPAQVESLGYMVAKIRRAEPSLGEPEILAAAAKRLRIQPEQARQMYQRRHLAVSTSEPAFFSTEEVGPTVGDELRDGAPLPDELAIEREERQIVRASAERSARNRREREIIRRRWLSDDVATLSDLGASFNRSRERIRQLETVVLSRTKMRLVSEGIGADRRPPSDNCRKKGKLGT